MLWNRDCCPGTGVSPDVSLLSCFSRLFKTRSSLKHENCNDRCLTSENVEEEGENPNPPESNYKKDCLATP
jgi:hypothetical protein